MRFSIITVSYQAAKTLEKTLLSVQSQKGISVEHIVVDGGSTDGTLSIIEKHAGKLTQWLSEPDKGIYDAMNKGLGLATGDIVGFLNADDHYPHPNVLSHVAKCFKETTNDACFGDLVYFSANQPQKICRYWRATSFQPGLFAKGWCPPHPTFFVRKTVYDRYGGFNCHYKMGNDVELMMRFLEKYRIQSVYLPEVLVNMQIGGVSNQSFKNILLQNQEVLKAAKDLAIPISPFSYWTNKCIDRLLQFVRLPQRSMMHES